MSSTTPSMTASLASKGTKLSGHIFAIPGAIIALISLFLPWLDYVADGTVFLSLTGREAASSPAITSGSGAELFRAAPTAYLVPLLGLVVLALAALAFRRGYVTEWDGFTLVGLGILTLIFVWLQFTSAQKIADKADTAVQSGYGLIGVYLALLAIIIGGVLHVRKATERKPSLKGLLSAWGFMSPAIVLILVFFIIPVIITLTLSLTDLSSSNFSEPWNFVGLDNYRRMFSDTFFPKILGNTFRYVILTLGFFNVGLALVLALLTTHISRRAGFIFRILWLLPRITPSVVYIVMWRRFVQVPPHGIINQFISWFGGEFQPYWLTEAPWLFVVMANGFVGASFGMIIFSSAIEAIPKDVMTAAKVDGAAAWQIIRDITLPLLKWPLLFVTTYQTLSLLVSFEYILLLTQGGPGLYETEVWSLTAYNRALATYFGSNQWGYGAAWMFVLVVIGATLATIYLRVFRFDDLVAEPKIDVL